MSTFSCYGPNGPEWARSTTTGGTTPRRRAFAWSRSTFDHVGPNIGLRRCVDRFPFVPDDPVRLEQDCYEAYNIQVSGLEQRLRAIGDPKIVIGVSGGLDSTHALVVAARAMDRLERPRSDILAFTLPGFATSDRTRSNAAPAGRRARRRRSRPSTSPRRRA